MDSKKFEILMTAVNLGSFSKASEVVGYTQSGLTHLINGLEREIGMKLIRRDHSGISLTEDGEALLPAIREYLSATAKLENQIETITQKRTATIRIAAYASLAMHWMPEILYRFRRVCPETDVDLRMVDHELEPFELLEEGRTDVIFAARQSHINCDWTPLYYDAMYAILPEDYPDQADSSGSGFVYYINTSRAFTWEDPLDGSIYQGWRYPYVRSGQTLEPDYRSLSPENIQLLLES